MNYVNRRKAPVPAILLDAKLKHGGPQETKRAIAFYRKKANANKPFAYKVYSHEEVKTALESLFHRKCAYCEGNYAPFAPSDVEHWRPKGEIETGQKHKIKPGYYWLAATWENLLPSCIDCNRRRYHEVGLAGGKKQLLGKKDSFPLEPGSPQALRPGQEKHERPLLLNPCEDKPYQYLEYLDRPTPFDRRALLTPKTAVGRKKRVRAETSIEVFALNRSPLVLDRKRVFIDIQRQMKRIEDAAMRLKRRLSATVLKKEQETFEFEMKVLLDYQAKESPYTAMARQMITDFLRTRT